MSGLFASFWRALERAFVTPPLPEGGPTEADWLEETHPGRLLGLVRQEVSVRRLRLVAAHGCRACLAHGWGDEPWCREGIETALRYADGRATEAQRSADCEVATRLHLEATGADFFAVTAVAYALESFWTPGSFLLLEETLRYAAAASRLRASAGSAPVSIERPWLPLFEERMVEEKAALCAVIRELFGNPFRRVVPDPAWLAHAGGMVRHLAEAIHCEGRWQDVPVLADALEDAGCSDEHLLAHCRQRAGHLAGCWAVDLLRGVEP